MVGPNILPLRYDGINIMIPKLKYFNEFLTMLILGIIFLKKYNSINKMISYAITDAIVAPMAPNGFINIKFRIKFIMEPIITAKIYLF